MKPALGLSDEEFLNKDPAEFLAEEEALETDTQDQETPSEEEVPSSEDVPSVEDTDDDSEAQEETESEAGEEEVSQPDEEDPSQEHEPSSDSEETESLDTSDQAETETKEETPETGEFDYKSAYEKVASPFKANGTEIQVKDPTDIVRLMQMGANYQKKMQQLKPHLKIVKMLENNELLDEAKLHELIDLSKRNPKAVAKFIKDSGVDPLDIDTDNASDYTPTNYTVSDSEYNLDQVLNDIKDTDTFDRTITVLTKEWDSPSKKIISENPEVISIINSHMSNGVYDMVNKALQQEKALGKLQGVSDVEAYRLVAEDLQRNGILRVDEAPSGSAPDSEVSSETETRQTKADLSKKRKAAAPVKKASSSVKPTEEDFLGLSDEEFMAKFSGR